MNLQPFVDKLREGYDLVMGNRFAGGIQPGAMPPLHRYFGNPLLTLVGRSIHDHDACGDFYCGLRGFRAEAVRGLHVQSQGMEFALEMLIKSELYRLKITEVPTTLSPDGRDRSPPLRTWKDGWRSLRLFLLLSPRWTFGLPGLALAALGGAAFLVAFFAPMPDAAERVLGVFGATGVSSGYQALLLAIFAKFVAIETGLHPPATKFWKLREPGTLERFLVVGAIFALLSSLAAVLFALNFSQLVHPDSEIILWALLSVTTLIIAAQTIMAGFTFGILQLVGERRRFPRKRREDLANSRHPSPSWSAQSQGQKRRSPGMGKHWLESSGAWAGWIVTKRRG